MNTLLFVLMLAAAQASAAPQTVSPAAADKPAQPAPPDAAKKPAATTPTQKPATTTAAPKPAAASTATLEVRVTDRSGKPTSNARVAAEGLSSRNGTTASDGSVMLRTMSFGTYRVRAEANGFLGFEKEIVIKSGAAPVKAEFALSPAPRPASPTQPPSLQQTLATTPVGQPRLLSVPDLAEKSLGGRDPVTTVAIGCSGVTTAQLIVLRESQPATVNAREDEMLYLVAGEVLLKLGENERALTPGWFSVAPRGIARQLTKKGRNPAILLSITSGRACDQSAAVSAQR